jgi:hypothetical protein
MAEQARFERGDPVIDRSGFEGTVVKVTRWRGSVWYDVRFRSGVAVRYDYDLKLKLCDEGCTDPDHCEHPAPGFRSRDYPGQGVN